MKDDLVNESGDLVNDLVNDTISRAAAIKAADSIIERDTSGNNDVVRAMTAWKEYIKALPSAQRWISCKTKFPEKDGSYLVTAYNGQMAIYLFVKGMSENYWKQWGATAWCELPTPYREGGQDETEQ